MPNAGTVTVSTSGFEIAFGSDAGYRAKFLQIDNLGGGAVGLDISTTSGCSTGYQLADGDGRTLSGLGGLRGFSAIASTAGGSVTLAYLASR
jgi:hypothetical protein